jgi:hypothetical protein
MGDSPATSGVGDPAGGKARELVLLRELLLDGDVRAVTITGPAGVGTRPLATRSQPRSLPTSLVKWWPSTWPRFSTLRLSNREGCAKLDVACELRVRVRGSVW